MLCKDVSFPNPAENILFDEVLFHLAEKEGYGESLRFWEAPSYFVVLGRIGKIKDDINTENTSKDKIPILRRSSGGGTVLQGPGCLNYSLVLSKELRPELNDLKRSYVYILKHVTEALKKLGLKVSYHPISDIALDEGYKKFSGNAQKRGRTFILHHGTILYNFNLDLVQKYLLLPKDMPEYRGKRQHLNFVSNIDKKSQDIKDVLKEIFGIHEVNQQMSVEEKDCLKKFLETKIYRAI
jgi:lipoate-protein ligase A